MSRNGLILMFLGTAAIYLNAHTLGSVGHDPLMAFTGVVPLAFGLFREVL